MTDPLIQIPLDDLRMVLPFMGSNDVRYYLNGVLVEPHNGGCMLVATNGHILAAIESKAARCDQSRILALSTDEFRAAARGRIAPYRMGDEDEDEITEGDENFEGTLEIADLDARAVVYSSHRSEKFILPGKPFIDGKYPDWRKVVPPVANLKPGIPHALAGQYLALFNHRAITNPEYKGVRFWGDDRGTEDKPNAVVVRFYGAKGLVVAIMPIKTQPACEWTWPDWMKAPVAELAASEPA